MTAGFFERDNDDWQYRANCRGSNPELFFPPSAAATREQCRAALALCDACGVARECLSYALRTNSCGVWGNTTEFERDVMRRRQRAAERQGERVAS